MATKLAYDKILSVAAKQKKWEGLLIKGQSINLRFQLSTVITIGSKKVYSQAASNKLLR